MNEKQLIAFITHLNRYNKYGDIYYQKGYNRGYTEKEMINNFIKKYEAKT